MVLPQKSSSKRSLCTLHLTVYHRTDRLTFLHSEEADFSTHPKAISRASQVKLVRYQQNPTANWGPGSRPGAGGSKRKREEAADS